MSSIPVCRVAEVPADGMLRVERDGLPAAVLVVRVGDELFVVDDRCSHQEASLSEGWLEGYCIECPMHESRFDIRTGLPDAPPARDPVQTHQVMIVSGTVFVEACKG